MQWHTATRTLRSWGHRKTNVNNWRKSDTAKKNPQSPIETLHELTVKLFYVCGVLDGENELFCVSLCEAVSLAVNLASFLHF